MSTQLSTLDLTAVVVGSIGTIDLSNCAPTSNSAYTQRPATLQAHNESRCGLILSYRLTGGGVNLPAGGWQNITIPAGETFIDWKVDYILPHAQVNRVLLTYYSPNEEADPISSLGNSPVNVANQVSTGQVYNAILECNPSLTMTGSPPPQVIPLTNQRLNLAGVSAATPGYLLLDYLLVRAGGLTFKNTLGNRELATQKFTVTVPNGGGIQTFLFAPANWFTGIAFFTFGTCSISDVQVKRSQDPAGSYVELLVPGGTNTNTHVDLTTFFGKDGMANIINQAGSTGFSIQMNLGNSSGSNQTFTMECYGQQIAYDEATWSVSYVDWNNNVYDIGDFKQGQRELFPLDMLVPIPITNPAQTNFGSLQFQLIGSQTFYDTTSTIAAFIPAAISFIAP